MWLITINRFAALVYLELWDNFSRKFWECPLLAGYMHKPIKAVNVDKYNYNSFNTE